MPKLICKKVKFFSQRDEERFFEWIKSVNGVLRCKGVLDEIHIFVRARLSDGSKHELWGLFKRYKIQTKQLEELNLLPSYWKNRKPTSRQRK